MNSARVLEVLCRNSGEKKGVYLLDASVKKLQTVLGKWDGDAKSTYNVIPSMADPIKSLIIDSQFEYKFDMFNYKVCTYSLDY